MSVRRYHRTSKDGTQIGAAIISRSPVTLPARLRGLVSSREGFRSSTRPSTSPCGCRTKAASGATESKPRALLGGHSRLYRRTRMSVVPVMACITSEHGSQSLLIRNRKRNFNSIDMNAPTYYERLQEEFRRLHALGWTFCRMAEVLGISGRTVTAWREELDLPRRPRGRRPRKPRG